MSKPQPQNPHSALYATALAAVATIIIALSAWTLSSVNGLSVQVGKVEEDQKWLTESLKSINNAVANFQTQTPTVRRR